MYHTTFRNQGRAVIDWLLPAGPGRECLARGTSPEAISQLTLLGSDSPNEGGDSPNEGANVAQVRIYLYSFRMVPLAKQLAVDCFAKLIVSPLILSVLSQQRRTLTLQYTHTRRPMSTHLYSTWKTTTVKVSAF